MTQGSWGSLPMVETLGVAFPYSDGVGWGPWGGAPPGGWTVPTTLPLPHSVYSLPYPAFDSVVGTGAP